MCISFTTTGFGCFGLDALEKLLTISNNNFDLYWYDAGQKSLNLFTGSTGISKGSTLGEPIEMPVEKTDQKDISLYIIDVEEHPDLNSLCTLSNQARDRGNFTVAVITAPLHEPTYSEGGQLVAVLKNLSKMVDSTIVLSNKANSTSPAEAVAGVIEFLSSTGTKKNQEANSVDLEDLKYILLDTGVVLAGVAEESGKDRSVKLVRNATSLPFMPSCLRAGSPNLLMNITSGTVSELEMDELEVMTESVQALLGLKDEIFFGYELDEGLGDKVRLQLVVPINIMARANLIKSC
jgi:hypothetical protein